MSRFVFHETLVDGLSLVERKAIDDERGYMERLFCVEDLREMLGNRSVAQINRTVTKEAGTIRGLHFQNPPYSELKVVSCVRGSVFDVVVDLRKGSPTFLQWHSQILCESNKLSFVIPEGFAHGFQSLSDNCELIYIHTSIYEPSAESALNPLDTQLAIQWPLPITQISKRDREHPFLAQRCLGMQI